MKIYNASYGEQTEPRDIAAFEELVHRLEEDESIVACAIETDGRTGSTLLNITMPDFTETEELTLLGIYKAACKRTLRECEDGVKLCNRRLAELQGFKVNQCGKGGGHE